MLNIWLKTFNIREGQEEEIYLAAKEGSAACYHYLSKQEMMEDANSIFQKGDTILIKASHGMGFSELVTFCSSHTWI